MALDVKVKIDLQKPVGKLGFGNPLILEEKATKEIAYKECGSLAEVVAAGFAETTKVYKAANTMFMQGNPPAKIAVCATTDTTESWLNDIGNVGRDWRRLVVVSTGDTINVSGIIAKIETLKNKMYFADLAVDDSNTYAVKDVEKTVLFYSASDTDFPSPVSALVGEASGRKAGSFTYKNLKLKGIPTNELLDTEVSAIHAKGGITFVTKAGDNVTSEGKVAGGEYVDVVDSIDYIVSNIEYNTQKTLNTMDKIPYDNTGIAILESVCVDVMKDAYNNGIIATNDDGTPAYTVSYLMRENSEATDRAARRYIGGRFAFTLAGAIHDVEVTGEIVI